MPERFAIDSSTSLPSGLHFQLVAGLQVDFASLYKTHEQDAGTEGDKSCLASSDGGIDVVIGNLGDQRRGCQKNQLLLAARANHSFRIGIHDMHSVIKTQQHGTTAKEAPGGPRDENAGVILPGTVDRTKLTATRHPGTDGSEQRQGLRKHACA